MRRGSGQPTKLSGKNGTKKCYDPNLARAKALYEARQNTIAEIMQMTGFKSRNTFYKYVVNGDALNP